MKQGANRLRRVAETAEELAEMPTRASPDSAVASRAIPIDLRPVISAYRKRGRFMLRVEKLPQLARFSAGQNNGDGSWSLLLDELEDLVYFAPKTVSGDHTLAIRLIAKDETEAFTIALIDFPIRGESDGGVRPAESRRGDAPTPLPDSVRDELHQLKAALEARETELTQLRESAERMGVMLQQKLDVAVAEAKALWQREEAARLGAERTRLEEQFGHRVAEREMRAQAIADIARDQQESGLRLMRQEFAATKEALAARDSELNSARVQLERLRKDWEAEIASTKTAMQAKAAEALKSAELAWAAKTDKALGELKAKHDAVQAMAGEAAKTARVRTDGELAELRAQLDQMRQQSKAELASAKAALQTEAVGILKSAEADWRARMDKALAEARAGTRADRDSEQAELRAALEEHRRQAQTQIASVRAEAEAKAAQDLKAAEAAWTVKADKALAEARTGLHADRDGERAELRAALERQRQQSQADIASARTTAEVRAAETLKAAEAAWQARSDQLLAAMTARCEAAEAALAMAREPGADHHWQKQVEHLQMQLEQLRTWSQAEIAAVKATAETREAHMLKTAEAEWRTHSDAAMAEVVARCEAAETALATAEPGAALAQRDAEIQHLRVEIERQGQVTEADISTVKAATEAEAEARLKMAQARWENTAAAALADTVARCEAAETALANAKRVNAKRTDDDEYVHSLEREIKTLRATLVDREAAIVHAQAMQEHVRLGTVRDTPGMRWQPLTNRSDVGEEAPSEKDKSNRQLLRDVGVVVMAAAAAVLLFPKAEAMLPDNIRWQIETMGGLFAHSEVATAPAARPAIVASTQPKVEHPVMYASRSINVRTQPSTGSAIVVNLKRGAAVTVLEKRGSWDRVEAPGPQNVAAQGWVFNTYLAESDPGSAPVATAAAAPSPAAPASSNAAGPETPQAVAAPSPEPVAAGTVTPPAEAPAPTP